MVEFWESIITTLLVVSSVVLLGYWFRYTCLLILAAQHTRDYSCKVALANRLCFPGVRSRSSGSNDTRR
jgi:hypothetical protein